MIDFCLPIKQAFWSLENPKLYSACCFPLCVPEVNKKEIDVISVPGNGTLLIHEPKQKVDLTKFLENHVFQFDYSFDETATNDLVYK